MSRSSTSAFFIFVSFAFAGEAWGPGGMGGGPGGGWGHGGGGGWGSGGGMLILYRDCKGTELLSPWRMVPLT